LKAGANKNVNEKSKKLAKRRRFSMKNELFRDLKDNRRSKRKWFFFPMSLLLHALVIGAVVVVPLMSVSESGPVIKVVRLIAAAPAIMSPPPPPPPPPANRASRARPQRPAPAPEPVEIQPQRLLTPVHIPDEIDIDEAGLEDGLDGGGFEGGEIGGEIGGVPGGKKGGKRDGILGGSPVPGSGTMPLGSIDKPKLIKKVEPNYPGIALKAKIQGMVVVEAATDIYGKVVKVNVIAGHPLLRAAAVQAVKQWIYEPYLIYGNPKPVRFTVTLTFSLINR
jgi:protein TonB